MRNWFIICTVSTTSKWSKSAYSRVEAGSRQILDRHYERPLEEVIFELKCNWWKASPHKNLAEVQFRWKNQWVPKSWGRSVSLTCLMNQKEMVAEQCGPRGSQRLCPVQSLVDPSVYSDCKRKPLNDFKSGNDMNVSAFSKGHHKKCRKWRRGPVLNILQ